MNALFEEQNNIVAEASADAVLPVSVFGELVLHHESFVIKDLKNIVEQVGGSISGEVHHV